MKTECPHCGQHYEIDDQYEGKWMMKGMRDVN